MSDTNNINRDEYGGPVNSDASFFRDTGFPIDYPVVGCLCFTCGSGEVYQPMQTMDMPMQYRCLRCGICAPVDQFRRIENTENEQ